MNVVIGIDTGGTYTDAAVLNEETREVLASAKALTTKDNLETGIENALGQVPEEYLRDCKMVALSTTLATNACVEKKYGKAKLILFGTDKESALRITAQLGAIPPGDLLCIDTKTKFSGEIPCMPDWEEFAGMVREECGGCDVIAVSEVYTAQTGSVLERKARDIIQSVLGKTVVCGYELFEELGFIKRGLGAYLNGTRITVLGNAQDATGDTMNDGAIFVHGSSGDATGYAMRGGKIYVRGNAGYRAGIHMKAYREKQPVLIIGGEAGSFLGEYQAGGIIIVLGLGSGGRAPVGRFVGTGMHGGRMLLRCDTLPPDLPAQVAARRAGKDDLAAVEPYLAEYCGVFGLAQEDILRENFFLLEPNTQNPYRQLYCYS